MGGLPGGITIRPLAGMVQALARYGQNLFQPPNNTIKDIDANAWYSPLEPITPFAPDGTEPRGFQYWWGQNLTWTPRFDAVYSAAELRSLATYPLARVCIENVKDSICKANWEIQPRPQPGEPRKAAAKRGIGDANLQKLNKFFERPDREHVWPDWLRPFLDDMLTIDAACLLIRRTFSGEIIEIPSIRGELIVRYIDENGFTPMPPQPAYAQNWWGIPLVNMTTDQCIYRPRNIAPGNTVSSMLYGRSQTEIAAPWIEVGIERLAFILAYYKEGSIPGVVQVVPKDVAPDKIAEAMRWMNSELAGNLAARRQWRMVQGFNEPGKNDQIILTKEPLLADLYDELHLRQIAFAYGVSPQRLAKQMNRASAQTSEESSDIEGLLPLFAWLKNSVIDDIIQRKMGYDGYEMVFDAAGEPNPEKQGVILVGYVKSAILTPNECRAKLGEEPSSAPEADQLGVETGTGFVPLGSMGAGLQPGELPPKPPAAAGEPAPKLAAGEEDEGDEPTPAKGKPNKPNGHKLAQAMMHTAPRVVGFAGGVTVDVATSTVGTITTIGQAPLSKKLKERGPIAITPGKLLPNSILAKHGFDKTLRTKFKAMNRRTTKILAEAMGAPHAHLAKADERQEAILKRVLAALADDWQEIADSADEYLTDSALAGASNGSLQLEISDEGMLGGINETARTWAQDRAAELVGKKWDADGNLIDNPNAKWAISDTTRDKVKEIITRLFEQDHVSLRDVENQIEATGVFGDVRASTIARNEIARSQTQGNLKAWRESKLVKSVNWVLSPDHDSPDDCDSAADASPYELDAIPSIPLHVNCLCSLLLNELSEGVE